MRDMDLRISILLTSNAVLFEEKEIILNLQLLKSKIENYPVIV